MAIVDVGQFLLPTPPGTDIGCQPLAGTPVGKTLDGTNVAIAHTFTAPKAGDVRKVGFLLGTVTSAQDVTVSMQDIDLTSGDPDGVQDQTATLAAGSQASDTWVEVTFGSDRTVDEGDHVAVVYEWAATQGDIEICNVASDTRGASVCSCWYQVNTGAWAGKETDEAPILYVEYADASTAWIYGLDPYTSKAAEAINTGTTPDEIALKFKFPVSIRVSGMQCPLTIGAAAVWDYVLYDSDGSSVLGSITGIDEDETIQSVGGPYVGFWTQGPQTLLADTFYYASVKPTAAQSVSPQVITVDAAKILDAWSGGQTFHYASQVDAGGWTPVTTKRPSVYLVVTGIEGGGAADSRLVGGGLVG